MRLHVDHVTRYAFSEPQARLLQLLRMRPCDTDHQTVIDWRFDVDCDARLKKHEDGFGNEVTMLYADGPIEAIEIHVVGEVLTDDSGGIVEGAAEPFPPELFLRTTQRTRADDALRDFAAEYLSADGDRIEQLHRLNLAIGERLTLEEPKVDNHTSAVEAFGSEKATAREMAQIFVAAARSAGVPARYVSGYRSGGDGASRCAPHGWAEAFVENVGWIGFDPASGISSDERYVRVAVGLDSADTAPIAGSRSGSGDEELDVEVQVEAASRNA
ncbi:transglutaminase family protein [Stakelama marina]|uniref:Transglutaminase domain-containing protein n=1 Tax=Stakelama marina TaxID=2826939 RepID=A0A8T4IB51_9SPHN|nr:transglutaminase domain-containing protein [Stakelama marina]MBR0552248.1 transglutaminase domain-containing protein [Stakelama marina]